MAGSVVTGYLCSLLLSLSYPLPRPPRPLPRWEAAEETSALVLVPAARRCGGVLVHCAVVAAAALVLLALLDGVLAQADDEADEAAAHGDEDGDDDGGRDAGLTGVVLGNRCSIKWAIRSQIVSCCLRICP